MNKKIVSGIVGLGILVGVWSMISTDEQEFIHAETKEHHNDDSGVKLFEIYPGIVAEKISNNENVILLDVRTIEEYEEVHLKGVLLLPVQELSQETLAAIGLGESAKDKEIIL